MLDVHVDAARLERLLLVQRLGSPVLEEGHNRPLSYSFRAVKIP